MFQLKSYDRELEAFENQLHEFPLNFAPSYPFEESVNQATAYMQTRCPAWCDRVLLSQTAKALVNEEEKIEYNVMGKKTCMGDHKVIKLVAMYFTYRALCLNVLHFFKLINIMFIYVAFCLLICKFFCIPNKTSLCLRFLNYLFKNFYLIFSIYYECIWKCFYFYIVITFKISSLKKNLCFCYFITTFKNI